MAQIKSQMKRNLTNEKKRAANSAFKTSLRTAMKTVEQAIAKNDKAAAVAALNLAYKKLDKSVAKNLHHKNFASREKARLAEKVNTLK